MSLKIIRQEEWDNEIVYSLNFLERDCLSQGYSFPCDKWGIVDPNISIEAKENLRKCLDCTYDVIVQGIFEHERDFKIPALAECECGNQIELDGDTICHKCEREYNSAGQLLAPRHLWTDTCDAPFNPFEE